MRLSPTMLSALGEIIAQYDRDVALERERWGNNSAERLAAKGTNPVLICSYRTLHALADRKMIEITSAEPQRFGERLRKGSFGRRLGGTVEDSYVQFHVKPTQLGRQEWKRRITAPGTGT